MIAKYLTAGFVSAALTAGAVYFGADGAQHPHKSLGEAETASSAAPAETIKSTPKPETVSEAPASDATTKSIVDRLMSKGGDQSSKVEGEAAERSEPLPDQGAEPKSDTPSKPMIFSGGMDGDDQGRDLETGDLAIDPIVERNTMDVRPLESSQASDNGKARWLDEYLKSRGGEAVDATPDADKTAGSTAQMTPDAADRPGPDALSPGMELAKEDHSIRTVVKGGEGRARGRFVVGGGKADTEIASDGVYDLLIDQASALQLDDTRDDAFLNILDFALTQDDIADAEAIIDRLSTPELRDTARQRIGIAHASAGRMDAAFDVVETLEIEALSDPIRLEIIRAATRPKN